MRGSGTVATPGSALGSASGRLALCRTASRRRASATAEASLQAFSDDPHVLGAAARILRSATPTLRRTPLEAEALRMSAASEPQLDRLLALWEELTGRRLSATLRGKFVNDPLARQLECFSEVTLRRTAPSVRIGPRGQRAQLKLRAWLRAAEAFEERRIVPRDLTRSRRSYEVHTPPVDSELHRWIGSTQRYDEDT
jgi:hypothetical protein